MGKKKEHLSAEEALAQALVPESEWPYQVPGNWVWTRLDNVAIYKKGPFGSSITKAMFVPKGKDTYKIYEQGNAIRKDKYYGNYYITKEKYDELKGFKVYSGDLIVSCAGTIGETYLLPDDIEPGIINQALMKINVNENISLQYYLFYFDQILREDIAGSSKGTAIKNIPPFSVLKNIPFPLPPLAEQQRIVNRIESLFEKLDQAKALIQDTLDSFENRKNAILHKAFSGELTKQWREENGVGMESWENRAFGELISESKLGIVKGKSEQSFTACYKYLKMNNITISGLLTLDEMISIDATEEEVEVYKLQKNDYLFNARNSRELVGKNAVFNSDFDEPILYNNNIMRVRFKTGVEPSYISYYLNSPEGKTDLDVIKKVTTNVAAIYSKDLNKIEIPLPSQNEQQEIVNVVSSVLQKDKCAFDLCSLMDTIDHMKKSILARAFRGELGTNDPVEESSLVLLKDILG